MMDSPIPEELLLRYTKRMEQHKELMVEHDRNAAIPVKWGQPGLAQGRWQPDDQPRPEFYWRKDYEPMDPYQDPAMREAVGIPPSLFRDDGGDRFVSFLQRGSWDARWRSGNPVLDGVPVGAHPEVTQLTGQNVFGYPPGLVLNTNAPQPDKQCSQCGEYGHFSMDCPFHDEKSAVDAGYPPECAITWLRKNKKSFSIIKAQRKLYYYERYERTVTGALKFRPRWAGNRRDDWRKKADTMPRSLGLREIATRNYAKFPNLKVLENQMRGDLREMQKFGMTAFVLASQSAEWRTPSDTMEGDNRRSTTNPWGQLQEDPAGHPMRTQPENEYHRTQIITKQAMHQMMTAKTKMLREDGYEMRTNSRFITYSEHTQTEDPVMTVAIYGIPAERKAAVQLTYGATIKRLREFNDVFCMIANALAGAHMVSTETVTGGRRSVTATLFLFVSMGDVQDWAENMGVQPKEGMTVLDIMVDSFKEKIGRTRGQTTDNDTYVMLQLTKEMGTDVFGLKSDWSDYHCTYTSELPVDTRRGRNTLLDAPIEELYTDLVERYGAEQKEIKIERQYDGEMYPMEAVVVELSMEMVLSPDFVADYNENMECLQFVGESCTHRTLWLSGQDKGGKHRGETLKDERKKKITQRMQGFMGDEQKDEAAMVVDDPSEYPAVPAPAKPKRKRRGAERMESLKKALMGNGTLKEVTKEDLLELIGQNKEHQMRSAMEAEEKRRGDDRKEAESTSDAHRIMHHIQQNQHKYLGTGANSNGRNFRGNARNNGGAQGRGGKTAMQKELEKKDVLRRQKRRKELLEFGELEYIRGREKKSSMRRLRRLDHKNESISSWVGSKSYSMMVPGIPKRWMPNSKLKERKRLWAANWLKWCHILSRIVQEAEAKRKFTGIWGFEAAGEFLMGNEITDDGRLCYEWLNQVFVGLQQSTSWYGPNHIFVDDTDDETTGDGGPRRTSSPLKEAVKSHAQTVPRRYDDLESVIDGDVPMKNTSNQPMPKGTAAEILLPQRYKKSHMLRNNDRQITVRNYHGKIGSYRAYQGRDERWGVYTSSRPKMIPNALKEMGVQCGSQLVRIGRRDVRFWPTQDIRSSLDVNPGADLVFKNRGYMLAIQVLAEEVFNEDYQRRMEMALTVIEREEEERLEKLRMEETGMMNEEMVETVGNDNQVTVEMVTNVNHSNAGSRPGNSNQSAMVNVNQPTTENRDRMPPHQQRQLRPNDGVNCKELNTPKKTKNSLQTPGNDADKDSENRRPTKGTKGAMREMQSTASTLRGNGRVTPTTSDSDGSGEIMGAVIVPETPPNVVEPVMGNVVNTMGADGGSNMTMNGNGCSLCSSNTHSTGNCPQHNAYHGYFGTGLIGKTNREYYNTKEKHEEFRKGFEAAENQEEFQRTMAALRNRRLGTNVVTKGAETMETPKRSVSQPDDETIGGPQSVTKHDIDTDDFHSITSGLQSMQSMVSLDTMTDSGVNMAANTEDGRMQQVDDVEDAFEVCAMRVLAANDSGVLSAPTGDEDHDAQKKMRRDTKGDPDAEERKSPAILGAVPMESPMAINRRRRRRRKRTRPVSLDKLRVRQGDDNQYVYDRQNDSVRMNLSAKLKEKVWQTPVKNSPPIKRRKFTKDPMPMQRSDCVVGHNEVEEDTDDVVMVGDEQEAENERNPRAENEADPKAETKGAEIQRQPTEVIESDGAVTLEEPAIIVPMQCSQCGEYGHFSRSCPFTQRESEIEKKSIDGDDSESESESEAVNDGGSSGDDSYAPEKEVERTTSDRKLRSATQDEIEKDETNGDESSSGEDASGSEDEDI